MVHQARTSFWNEKLNTFSTPPGFFHKIFGGGDLLSRTIFWSPLGTASDGGLTSGLESDHMRGDLEKLSAEAKNAPLQQN